MQSVKGPRIVLIGSCYVDHRVCWTMCVFKSLGCNEYTSMLANSNMRVHAALFRAVAQQMQPACGSVHARVRSCLALRATHSNELVSAALAWYRVLTAKLPNQPTYANTPASSLLQSQDMLQ